MTDERTVPNMAEAHAGKAYIGLPDELRTRVREDPRRKLRDNDRPEPRMLTAARANGCRHAPFGGICRQVRTRRSDCLILARVCRPEGHPSRESWELTRHGFGIFPEPRLDDRCLGAPRPFGRGRALARGPKRPARARAPPGGGSRPIRVNGPMAWTTIPRRSSTGGVKANPTAQRMGRLSTPCPAPVFSRPGVAASERRAAVAVTGFWRPRERLLGRPLTVEISHASVRYKDGRPCERRQRPKQRLRGDHEQDHRRA